MKTKLKTQEPRVIQTQSFSAIVKEISPAEKKIVLHNPVWFQNQVNKFFKDGQSVNLKITSHKLQRTLRQNNYWWLYMTEIATSTGHTPEEIHEWAKGKFLTKKVVEVFGQLTRIKGSTTECSKMEFSDLITKVEAETGIAAPPIEEV